MRRLAGSNGSSKQLGGMTAASLLQHGQLCGLARGRGHHRPAWRTPRINAFTPLFRASTRRRGVPPHFALQKKQLTRPSFYVIRITNTYSHSEQHAEPQKQHTRHADAGSRISRPTGVHRLRARAHLRASRQPDGPRHRNRIPPCPDLGNARICRANLREQAVPNSPSSHSNWGSTLSRRTWSRFHFVPGLTTARAR